MSKKQELTVVPSPIRLTLAELHPGALKISASPGQAEGLQLTGLFQAAETAQLRLMILGLYAFGIKSRLQYGLFGWWLNKHAPDLARPSGKGWKPSSALNSYMQLAQSTLEAMGIDLTEWFPGLDASKKKELAAGKIKSLGWEPHQLLLFNEDEMDEAQKVIRHKLMDVLAGNTRKALVTRFVTVKDDDDADSGIVPTTGAGTYHATKADGSPRAPKRTRAQKLEDEANAAAAALLSTLQFWITEGRDYVEHISPAVVQELRGYTKDLHNLLNS